MEMTRKIGDCLPQFKNCEGLFEENKGVRDILYVFYRDHLRPALQKAFECDYRDLQSFADYNQQLLTDLLQSIGVTYVVLDGLDEISEKERHILLKGFLQMSNQCPDLKFMVSSREETDISGLLRSRVLSLRIGLRNSEDIELYFNSRVEEWLNTLEIDDATYSSLEILLQGVSKKAEGIANYHLCGVPADRSGMFLYVKLGIENLKSQLDVPAIRREAANLPTGLDQA